MKSSLIQFIIAVVFLIIISGCAPVSDNDSSSMIWYWQGYQNSNVDDRQEIEIWARIDPPAYHSIWRDERGGIVDEVLDSGHPQFIYISIDGMAVPWPRGNELIPEDIIYGNHQWSPARIERFRGEYSEDYIFVTEQELIQEELGAHFDMIEKMPTNLIMFTHYDESSDKGVVFILDEDGHQYFFEEILNGKTQRVMVFPRKKTVWKEEDPFTLLLEVRESGVFTSPLSPGVGK